MITSVHNPKIQSVRKLQAQAKARREEQAFVIEGVRLAEEALQRRHGMRSWYCSPMTLDERGKTIVDRFSVEGTQVEQVSEAVMKAVSETETPQGLLVVLAQRALPLPPKPDFLLILDGVRDPGNLGTILRSCSGCRSAGVLLAPGCADAWSPKVLRAGMGAHFHLPIHSLSWQDIGHTLKQPPEICRYIWLIQPGVYRTHRRIFALPWHLLWVGKQPGQEARQISLADEKVHIPMPGGSESLNAAIAASILLFEVVRQRTM